MEPKTIVSLVQCRSYELSAVKAALLESITHIGGLSPYVSPGERVFLKINLLMKKKPEEATTTHPAFVQALAEIFIENGNTVLMGDSPGGPFEKKLLTPLYQITGMTDVAAKTGAKLNENVASRLADNPQGLLLKKLTVTDMIYDADKVISVSKLKTHGMMTFTGAVKNMFGIIPGIKKAEYHLHMPEYNAFADALVDICIAGNPVLSFMDGIEAMEGEGPSAGTVRKCNAVLVSASPYHLDKVACSLIGLDFERVPIIKSCVRRGICSADLSDVLLKGESIESLAVPNFEIPETRFVNPMAGMPRPIRAILNNMAQPRPVFDYGACIGCNICAESCPAKVIEMKNKKPHVNLKDCIRCYCCQELCPKKAIKAYHPKLLRRMVPIYMMFREFKKRIKK